MKKLLIVILILLIIFVALLVQKNISKSNEVDIQEINQIEEYIGKIYLWKEVTTYAMPCFQNINDAQEKWIWEAVKKNIEQYEVDYEQINEKAKELFGEELKKEFPKEGTEYLPYQEDIGKYIITGTSLDAENDMFLLNSINKTKSGYEVDIIEYIEDYTEGQDVENPEEIFSIKIKNLKNEIVQTIPSNIEKTDINQIIKNSSDKFTHKILYFEKNDDKIFIQKVEEKEN